MGWWRAVLPNTTNTTTKTNTNTTMFDTLYKEDATPPGMAGYWSYPEGGSRALARDYVKGYYDERKSSIANLKPGRFHSITCSNFTSNQELFYRTFFSEMDCL